MRALIKGRSVSPVVWIPIAVCMLCLATDASAHDDDDSNEKELVFIHTGDFHGDLQAHSNLRAGAAQQEGGLARVATVVKSIRARNAKKTIYVHTGDTISGSAEATFTRGAALVKIVDQLGVDAFTPGNWEFSFGIYRYLQFFGHPTQLNAIAPGDENAMAVVIPPFEQGPIASYGKPFADGYRWGALSANAYYNGARLDPGVVDAGVGNLLTRPYKVMTVNGVKVGMFACTTNRGPQVVSSVITTGISFSNCKGEIRFPQNQAIAWDSATHPNRGQENNAGDVGFRVVPEIPKWVKHLREVEKVDLVVMLSEAGLAENIFNAENIDGIDLIFSSDMHEKTTLPVVVTQPSGKKTVIVEQGEDAAQVGELEVSFKNGKLKSWEWKAHSIDQTVREDPAVAALVAQVVSPYYAAGSYAQDRHTLAPWYYQNPYNGAELSDPLDTVIGVTEIELSRNRFSNEYNPGAFIMPAVIEGSGHDLIVDAFRVMSGADVGAIRGFRYTNTVAPGPITLGDIYHYMPIGAMVAKASIPATPLDEPADKRGNLDWPRNLLQEIELSGNSSMDPLVTEWSGGWVWNYSGIHFDFEPFNPNFKPALHNNGSRVSNAILQDAVNTPLSEKGQVMYASYYYDGDPNRVNRNQIVPNGQCRALGLSLRECAKDKISILAQTSAGVLVYVNPVVYKAGLTDGSLRPLDAVEVVRRYIQTHLNARVRAQAFDFPRINLSTQLVDSTVEFGFAAIEPLRGAPPAGFVYPVDYRSGVADTPSNKGRF